ncbi:fibronectin type III domain-containing protein [Kitasatospora sp. MMS16-BH015]|uniref:hypothetical protein n=1 Tax=Kitasatospora sp. MMS16-BH015 TaxID=2018025 RepID=UPI000CA0EED5|nr:hypothetical protein [Kitasatospora sp. MMS16-BH015]AUG76305.1 fibronectin type III domain-containing protein [Kitasatospora sp. MMS16-BH015]
MDGLDFGDSFARLAWADPGGRPAAVGPAQPATVRRTPGGGLRAERAEGAFSARARLLGRPGPEGEAAVGCVLAELVRQTVEAGRPHPGEVLLGVPAYGTGEATLVRAVEAANLRVAQTLPEPVAVLLHYAGVRDGVRSTVLVHDQGATGLRLTLLEVAGDDRTVTVVDSARAPIGGDQWDGLLAAELRLRYGLPATAVPESALRRAAEQLRLALGSADQAELQLGEQLLFLDRATLAAVTRPLREQAAAAADALLLRTGERGWEPPSSVLLAGGLGAAPEAGELLGPLGLLVRQEQPELAVARGLALATAFGMLWIEHAPAGPAPRRRSAWTPEPPPLPFEDPEPHQLLVEETKLNQPPVEDPEPHRPPVDDPEPLEALLKAPVPPPSPVREAPTVRPESVEEPPFAPPTPVEEPPSPAEEDPPLPPKAPPPSPAVEEEPSTALYPVPVTHLDALRRGDRLLVRWAWPAQSREARVGWQVDGPTPAGVAGSGELRCSRRGYEHDGGLTLPVGRGAVDLTVWAYAPAPAEPAAQSALRVEAEPPEVRYEVVLPKGPRAWTSRAGLHGWTARVVFTAEADCRLPPLRVVHGLGRDRPTRAGEGTVLHELPAQELTAGTPFTLRLAVPATRGPSWLVCLPVAPEDRSVVLRPLALHRLRVT